MWHIAWGLAGIAIGGFLGWFALREADLGEAIAQARDLDPRVLVLALGAVLFAGIMETVRWKLLLPRERVSLTRLFLVKNAGQALNNVSPIRVLAEVAQTAMLRYGQGIGTDKIVSSVLLVRLFDLLAAASLVGAGLIVLPQLAGYRPVVLPLWGLALGSILAVAFLAKPLRRVHALDRFAVVQQMLHSLGTMGGQRKVMLACMALTATAWMSIGTAAWLVANAAGIALPFWLISIVIVAVGLFSSAAPAPPGAVGVYEFVAISTLGLFAVDPSAALTFAVAIHALLFLPQIVIGAAVLTTERRTLSRVLSTAGSFLRPSGRAA